MSLVPAYLVFAFALIGLSALSTKICGWRTAPNGAWKLRDLEWPLLDWSRYMISTHVVRVLVGTFFRASFTVDALHALERRPHRPRRAHQQPVDLRSQHARVRRRRGDWRKRAPLGSYC